MFECMRGPSMVCLLDRESACVREWVSMLLREGVVRARENERERERESA